MLTKFPMIVPARAGKVAIGDVEYEYDDIKRGLTLRSDLFLTPFVREVKDNIELKEVMTLSGRFPIQSEEYESKVDIFLRTSGFNVQQRKELKAYIMSPTKEENWYGGRVYAFGKTNEGFLLCVEGMVDRKNGQSAPAPGNLILGIYIPSLDDLTDEGRLILKDAGLLVIEESVIESVEGEEKELLTPATEEPPEKYDVVRAAELQNRAKEIIDKKLATRVKRESEPLP